eukprot:m.1328882 g.1328882  ORF g.1328882 m.1328882 type:complete len:328 (-) comp24860_c0_seq4:1485-2468(-)
MPMTERQTAGDAVMIAQPVSCVGTGCIWTPPAYAWPRVHWAPHPWGREDIVGVVLRTTLTHPCPVARNSRPAAHPRTFALQCQRTGRHIVKRATLWGRNAYSVAIGTTFSTGIVSSHVPTVPHLEERVTSTGDVSAGHHQRPMHPPRPPRRSHRWIPSRALPRRRQRIHPLQPPRTRLPSRPPSSLVTVSRAPKTPHRTAGDAVVTGRCVSCAGTANICTKGCVWGRVRKEPPHAGWDRSVVDVCRRWPLKHRRRRQQLARCHARFPIVCGVRARRCAPTATTAASSLRGRVKRTVPPARWPQSIHQPFQDRPICGAIQRKRAHDHL